MISILLGTSQYEWALYPFANLYSKYFGGPILYVTDRIEHALPDNVNLTIVPAFRNGIWDWATCFGEGLKSIGYYFTDQIIAIFLLDHWLNSPVDTEVIFSLERYMINHPEIIRVNLTDDLSWHSSETETIDTWENLEIIEIKPWSIHSGYNGGISFSPSLWRAELLARIVQSGWSLWDCEKLGSEVIKVEYPKVRAIGSNPAVLTRAHGLVHGQPKIVNLVGLSSDDQKMVIESIPDGFTYLR